MLTAQLVVVGDFDELMDSKVFYYTDLHNPLHPFNLTNGPLDVPHTSYTEMWATKMRKVFNSLDRQKKGTLSPALPRMKHKLSSLQDI